MRKLLTTTALTLALLAPGAGSVFAQAAGGGSDDDTGGLTGTMTTTPRDASDDAIGTRGTTVETGDIEAIPTDHPLYNMRGEQIVGQTLYGSNGEEIGEVERVVAAQGSSNPEAVVGVGGFLGIGERSVNIPLSQIQMEGDRLTTSMTKEDIGAMQPHDESGYQEWDSDRAFGSTDQ
jgi:PRC-barrel domain